MYELNFGVRLYINIWPNFQILNANAYFIQNIINIHAQIPNFQSNRLKVLELQLFKILTFLP